MNHHGHVNRAELRALLITGTVGVGKTSAADLLGDLLSDAGVPRAAETLAFAGMGVTGAPGYIGMPAGPTTRVYFLPDGDAQVPRAGLDPVALPGTLMTGVSLIGHSARRVVTGYFEHHGVPWCENGHQVIAELPGNTTAKIDFDAAGRITAIRLPALR